MSTTETTPTRRGAAKRKKTPTLEQSARPQGKRLAWLVLKWGALFGLLCAALGAAAIATIFWIYGSDPKMPKIRTLNDYQPKQVTRIAAGDGAIVGEIFTERRTYVPIEQIPKLVTNAFIAAEDANFFQHQGLDYWGMVRAALVNVREGKKKQGASTITQQVVKTLLLSPEKTFRRKIQEVILARRLESALSKEDILSLYVNQIYFGHGRYGVAEAARFYFGKDLKDLNAGEAALLGGLPQSPERISPKKERNQERAKSRQKYVLEQMAYLGYITEEEARKYINEPIRIVRDPYPEVGVAPEWVEAARQELITRFGEDKLDTLGATVSTTVDLDIQNAARAALRTSLRAYDERHKHGRPVRKVEADQIDLEAAKLARSLPKGGPKRGESYLAVVREVHDEDGELVVDLGKWPASVILDPEDDRFNPPHPKTGARKKPSERFAAGDVIRVALPAPGTLAPPKHGERSVILAPGPEGAVVVIDPKTRKLLAMAGGFTTRVGDFNRALQAKRQPGSTFKPLVFAAALDTGDYTAASIVNDAPEVYDLWKPQNYKKGTFEGPVRLRYALAKSINTVAIRVLHDIGIDRVVSLARNLGITAALPESLSLALGSGEVTPLELTNAFATFAAAGQYEPVHIISEVSGQKNERPAPERVLSPEVAYVMVDMMTSVITEGTGTKAQSLGMPVSGKTGTSNDSRDAWFIGMTPSYVVGVWVGFDDNSPLGRGESGGATALPVFIELMKDIGKEERRRTFAEPSGVVKLRIDKASGLLAPETAADGTFYTEVFVAGTEPKETALGAGEAAAATFVQDEYDEYQEGGEGQGAEEAGAPAE